MSTDYSSYHKGSFMKAAETMRDDFTFTKTAESVARFPYPWPEDEYMYSVNMEPHPGGPAGSPYEPAFDLDEHYLSEMKDRESFIPADETSCRFQALPHMKLAQWDTLELMMESFAKDYPQYFSLEKNGNIWTWENKPLGIKDTFEFGQWGSLPFEPAEYIWRQAQGDFTILDQRDNDLWADVGMTTSAADWSLRFDVGMRFSEWHGPVPRAQELGVFDRALQFLLNMREPTRRTNWTLTVNARQDTATESFDQWGHERSEVTLENAGEKVHLRVELQTLFRLPRSNALLFSIRAYLCSFANLAKRDPALCKRAHRVLKGLPQDMVDYKGFTLYRDTIVEWLSQFDQDQ